MKTKIIYISGNELFEISEIRAAFEEVRNTLGLDKDTILFGVPVDADNALTQTNDTETQTITSTVIETPVPEVEPVATELIVEEKALTTQEAILAQDNEIQEPQPEIDEPVPATDEDAVIPILSVLGGTPATEEPSDVVDVVEEKNTDIAEIPSEMVADEAKNNAIDDYQQIETIQISIEDVVTDQVPVEEKEKTLEELLESMEPLGEDMISEPQPEQENESSTITDEDFSISMTDDMTDTDATLAQLANEFAQTQDQIPESPKASGNGKISKLKNILPFKKAKRDDNGLMGDLFGWAGIAANDEDFSIPGFFTSAGGQK